MAYAVGTHGEAGDLCGKGMHEDVGPTPDGIYGRVFPRPESRSILKIVQWLPVVEHFITV